MNLDNISDRVLMSWVLCRISGAVLCESGVYVSHWILTPCLSDDIVCTLYARCRYRCYAPIPIFCCCLGCFVSDIFGDCTID